MVVEAQGIYTHQMLLIRDWTRIATPQKNCTNVKHWGRKFVKGGVGAILRLDLVKRQTDVFFETSRTILLNLSKSDASNLLRVSIVSISYSASSICKNHWVNSKKIKLLQCDPSSCCVSLLNMRIFSIRTNSPRFIHTTHTDRLVDFMNDFGYNRKITKG